MNQGQTRMLLGPAAMTVAIALLWAQKVIAAPPVIASVSPEEVIQNTVPQPALTIGGSDFVVGLPSATNRPTVTLAHVGSAKEYSTPASVNFSGTQVTVPAGLNEFNLLQAPLGTYDLTVARPDGESITLSGAFEITDGSTDALNIKPIGTWGGPVLDVDVAGDLAYLANGQALRIINIADPGNAQEVGLLNLGAVAGVRVRDNYAFVAAVKPYRFSVVDVSDPSNPLLVWNGYERNGAPSASHRPVDVHLYGDLAYVWTRGEDVEVFDIADPHNVITHGTILWSDVGQLAIHGDRLYVGSTKSGPNHIELRIYDLSVDPLNPTLLGSVERKNRSSGGLAIDGDYAAWSVHGEPSPAALLIVDCSDPTAPAIIATSAIPVHGSTKGLEFIDGYIYGADQSLLSSALAGEGLVISDATDPTQPEIVASFKPHGSVIGVRVLGTRAFVLDKGEGLIIVDVSDPTQPLRIGRYYSPASMRDAVKVEDLLFVSDAWHGFTVLDISDPTHPVYVADYQAEHFDDLGVDAMGIAYHDDKIYLGAGHLGLEIVDVADPATPMLIEARRIPPDKASCSWYWDVDVEQRNGDVAVQVGYREFIPFCGVNGSYASNLLNMPAATGNDAILGQVQLPSPSDAIRTIAQSGGTVYIGREDGQQEIVDNTDWASPLVIHSNSAMRGSIYVALDGDTLYTANNAITMGHPEERVGLYVHDVSDPSQPIELAHINGSVPGGRPGLEVRRSYTIAVQNERAYASALSGLGNELFMFDVTEPSQPTLLTMPTLPASMGLNQSNGQRSATLLAEEPYLFYVSGITGLEPSAAAGLLVLEVENLPAPLPGDITKPFGTVDILDFLALLGEWGQCPPPCPPSCAADFDGDCAVGITDLLILLANWG